MSSDGSNGPQPSSDLPVPDWLRTLQYTDSFDDTKTQVLDAINQWYPVRTTSKLDLSPFQACVAIKSHDGIIAQQNPAAQHFTLGSLSASPHTSEAFALKKAGVLDRSTDQLIRDGVHSLEFDHAGGDQAGRVYTIHSMKIRLAEWKDPSLSILAISRPTKFLGVSDLQKGMSLAELSKLFQGLDQIDQMICYLDAEGDTTKHIAQRVGLSPRAIEMRRRKMQDLFQVQRPMELVRITIRLQEHGLLPG